MLRFNNENNGENQMEPIKLTILYRKKDGNVFFKKDGKHHLEDMIGDAKTDAFFNRDSAKFRVLNLNPEEFDVKYLN